MRRFMPFLPLFFSFLSAACARVPPPPASVTSGAAASPFVAHFDAKAGELAEGLLVARDAAYVGFAPSSRIVRIDVSSGAATTFGQLPAPVTGKGFMTGLAQSQTGEIYAGLASFAPEVQPGIYRIGKSGGASTLFAKDAALPFPNALAFEPDGTLWVTDSGTGSVFRIDSSGRAERWFSGDLLAGKKHNCGPGLGPEFEIGANGIVVDREAVYVVNTDKATLVKIPRDASGKASTPSLVAGPDCANLGGADGLVRAPDGAFVVAINRQNKIARVTAGGPISIIATGAPLDFPASVAYRGADLYVTNFALYTASAGDANAAPGLLRIGH